MTALDTGLQTFTVRLVLDGGRTIEIYGPGDITAETTEAIVNAANSYLLGGGGVDGAIHHAGGPAILAECRQIVSKIGTLPAGQAVITTGGRLAAKHVIHTVGPVYHGGEVDEAETLASCHLESIRFLGISCHLDGSVRISCDRSCADRHWRCDRGARVGEAREEVSIRTL